MIRGHVGGATIRWGAIAGLSALLLAGCKQGPDFFSPAAPAEKGYTNASDTTLLPKDAPGKRGAAQRVAIGSKIADDWWSLFRSPSLNGVVKEALRDNPTIAQGRAALAQARELTIAAAGGLLPQVDLGAESGGQAVNRRLSGVVRPPVSVGLLGIGPTVSYDLDVFGALKRQVESQAAQADVSDYQLAATYLALTGNVTLQAIQIAGLRAQIATVEQILADDQKNLNLVKTAQSGGTATMVDVTTAQTQLANDRTLLPPLRKQLSQARNALAVYVGKPPVDWSAPDFELAALTVPKVVPLSLPSELVRQRPDILAAEAQLHVAAANLGIATANLYPKFTLTAAFAQTATDPGNFFGAYSGWNALANMTAPIFHGGTLKAKQRAAKAAFDGAWASYRQVVIQAFGQVADQLQALAHDDEAIKTQTAALASAEQALRLSRLSYAAGNSTLLQLLDPERQMQQARLGVVRAQAQRLSDTAQLMVALGSGWWNTPPSTPADAPADDQTIGRAPFKMTPQSPTANPAPPATEPPPT